MAILSVNVCTASGLMFEAVYSSKHQPLQASLAQVVTEQGTCLQVLQQETGLAMPSWWACCFMMLRKGKGRQGWRSHPWKHLACLTDKCCSCCCCCCCKTLLPYGMQNSTHRMKDNSILTSWKHDTENNSHPTEKRQTLTSTRHCTPFGKE